MGIFWFQNAAPEEQGSFCDTQSEIHYDNVDYQTARESTVAAQKRGDEVVYDRREEYYGGTPDHYNLTLLTEDNQGIPAPAKSGCEPPRRT